MGETPLSVTMEFNYTHKEMLMSLLKEMCPNDRKRLFCPLIVDLLLSHCGVDHGASLCI